MENINELRKLDITKLNETLNKKQNELVDNKVMFSVGKSNDTSVFSKLKKDIARIKTVLKEKEVLNEQ